MHLARFAGRPRSARGGYFLDKYPGAVAAWSVRRLTADFTGDPVRVRESSGGTLADIPFTAQGLVDETALLAHVGANDGSVASWYDQIGSYDATQGTAASQPLLVDAGAVQRENGKLTLVFNSTAACLSADTLAAGFTGTDQPFTILAVLKSSGAAAFECAWGFGRAASITPIRYGGQSDTSGWIYMAERDDANVLEELEAGNVTTQGVAGWVSTGNARRVYTAGTLVDSGTTNLGATTLDTFTIGALRRTTTTLFFGGNIQEIIVFDADLTNDLPAMLADALRFW